MDEQIERILFHDEDTGQSFTFDWPSSLYLGGHRPGTIDGQYIPSEMLLASFEYAIEPSPLAGRLDPSPVNRHSARLLRDLWRIRVLTRQFKVCVEDTARTQVAPSIELRCEAWIGEAHFRVSTYTFLHWDPERPQRAKFKEISQIKYRVPAVENEVNQRSGRCWRAKLCGIEIQKPFELVDVQLEQGSSECVRLDGQRLIKYALTAKLG